MASVHNTGIRGRITIVAVLGRCFVSERSGNICMRLVCIGVVMDLRRDVGRFSPCSY